VNMIKLDAYISPTQRKKALKNHGYQLRIPQFGDRCGTCAHMRPAEDRMGLSQHDRHCSLFNTGVKTHGGCRQYAKATATTTKGKKTK